MVAGQVGKKKKIGAIIQARLTSTRLPGKIIMPLPYYGSKTVLDRIIEGLKESLILDDIFLAVAKHPNNDALVKCAIKNDVFFFEGDENNVLSRFTEIIKKNDLDIVVRITADNPFIDTKLLDKLIDIHINESNEYTYSEYLPLGMNFEVVDASVLLEIENQATKEDKEHVTSFIFKSSKYKTKSIFLSEIDKSRRIRLTIDYPIDYLILSFVMTHYDQLNIKGMELVNFLDTNFPWLFEINANQFQKIQYHSEQAELNAAIDLLNSLDFKYTADRLKKDLD